MLDTKLDNPEDIGIRIPLPLLKKVLLPYHDHQQLPQAGGVLDQDPKIMDAIEKAEYGIAWWKQNLSRKSLDELPELD